MALLALAEDFLPLTLADDLLLTLAIGVHVVRHHQDSQRDGQTDSSWVIQSRLAIFFPFLGR